MLSKKSGLLPSSPAKKLHKIYQKSSCNLSDSEETANLFCGTKTLPFHALITFQVATCQGSDLDQTISSIGSGDFPCKFLQESLGNDGHFMISWFSWHVLLIKMKCWHCFGGIGVWDAFFFAVRLVMIKRSMNVEGHRNVWGECLWWQDSNMLILTGDVQSREQ